MGLFAQSLSHKVIKCGLNERSRFGRRPQKCNAVGRKTNFAGCLENCIENTWVGDDQFGFGCLKLVNQFVFCVGWIGRPKKTRLE